MVKFNWTGSNCKCGLHCGNILFWHILRCVKHNGVNIKIKHIVLSILMNHRMQSIANALKCIVLDWIVLQRVRYPAGWKRHCLWARSLKHEMWKIGKSVQSNQTKKQAKHWLRALCSVAKMKTLKTIAMYTPKNCVTGAYSHGRGGSGGSGRMPEGSIRNSDCNRTTIKQHGMKWNEIKHPNQVVYRPMFLPFVFLSFDPHFYFTPPSVSLSLSLWFRVQKCCVCLIFKMDDDCLSFRLRKSKSIKFYFALHPRISFSLSPRRLSLFFSLGTCLDCNTHIFIPSAPAFMAESFTDQHFFLASSSLCAFDTTKHIFVKYFVTSKLCSVVFCIVFLLLLFLFVLGCHVVGCVRVCVFVCECSNVGIIERYILYGRINAIHHLLLLLIASNRSQCIDSRKLLRFMTFCKQNKVCT